jgi:hypothetical protein
MSKLFQLISFILLYHSIISEILKDGDTVSLVYYEYDFNISEIDVTLMNRGVSISEEDEFHLAFIHNLSDKDYIIKNYSIYFNHKWIFFANDKEVIKELLEYDYEEDQLKCFGILYPKNLEPKIDDYNGIPVFEINDNYTSSMEKWDIRNMNKNIFFSYKINHANDRFPEIYFLILSIIVSLTSISILVSWKYSIKGLVREHILRIHDIGFILIYLNIVICLLFLILYLTLRGESIHHLSDAPQVPAFFIDLLDIMHRTFLWLIMLLISCGWNITMEQLNENDCNMFIKMYIFLFIAFSVDPILDNFIQPIWTLQLSEIKNFFIYFLLLFMILTRINKMIRFLNLRTNYARLYEPNIVNALKYKIKLVKQLRILNIIYPVVYTLLVISHKTIFAQYDEPKLEMYDYLGLELIFADVFYIIFRPKQLPQFYNINLGDIEIEEENIYNYVLPQYSEIDLKYKAPSKKEIESCKKKNLPILVIGPTSSEDSIDNMNSINKYFLELNVGFAESDK